ncbi:MAG TPA: ABC transporter ATP-binding protein, partial [Deltaproteobacteria bacterium]|nr:ABC transporter ATP-binding protein [Deltaproteobacteria bacterium]
DEPTNDLDLLTLRILEEALLDFDGAAVVVTHDRAFLDRVCNAVVAFEGDGRVVRYASRQQAKEAAEGQAAARLASDETSRAAKRAEARARDAARVPSERPKKLTNREQREYAALPGQIESLEAELEALHVKMADPATWKSGGEALAVLSARAEALPLEIEQLYTRWEALEARANV